MVSILQKQFKNVLWINLYFWNSTGSFTIDLLSLVGLRDFLA